jgi:molybdopterin-synthase adenylyltransferase
LTPIVVHSHPGHDEAWYSGSDDHGEGRLLPALTSLLPGFLPGSLLVSRSSATGRSIVKGKFVPFRGLTILGTPCTKISFAATADELEGGTAERFDRQIRAFGKEGQRALQMLKIAIVGVGGIGSVVAEQLVRAGADDVVIVDNDSIEESNLTRIFGATARDVGERKVEVMAKHLGRLGARTVTGLFDSAIKQGALMSLRDRDVIFCCVDNDRARAIINRFAYQYMIPMIDHGSRLDARQGHITAAAGRVTISGSGFACLRCSHHINAERIRAESMSKEERTRLYREGYVMGIDEPVPAVVSINTVVGGLGATAGLNLFVSLTGGAQPVDQIYDARSGSVFPVSPNHELGCDICDETQGVKGLGDLQIVSAYD